MERRLVKQGISTLMVSLPSKWIKNFKLGKGSLVNIEESGSNLMVSAGAIDTISETSIKLTQYTESSIRTAIVNAYRSGFDRISIAVPNENWHLIIRKVLENHLIGFDIATKENNLCIIESIAEPAQNQFEIIFKKIFLNISALIQGTEKRLNDKAKFEEYSDIAMRIHQYGNFCRRVISKRKLGGSKTSLYWSLLTMLVHGQRELYHLNNFLDKNKLVIEKELIISLKLIFQLISDGYLNNDIKKLEECHLLEKKAIYNLSYNELKKGKNEAVAAYHIASAIRNFYLASSPLIGLLLESSNSK